MTYPPISQPIEFKSGLRIPNRIAKASTSEKLGDKHGAPGPELATLYGRWARGKTGLLLTGNVIVDPAAREGRGNVVVQDDRHLDALTRWADETHASGAKLIMQISHAGRQTPKAISRQPVAPSAVVLEGVMGMAGVPRELERSEIDILVRRFARTASVARQAGFDGVQLHGAHGYLISQFLSPHTNRRTDEWGGSLDNRMRFLLAVVNAVRSAVGSDFTVGVKLNSADFQRGGFDEDESMRVAEVLDEQGVDFLEVSGGNYESSVMFHGTDEVRESTRKREAYFLDYVEKIRARVNIPLMLTGGFRSAEGMNAALDSGAVDIVGMARPLIIEPDLPVRLLQGRGEAAQIDLSARSRLLENLFQGTWYGHQIRRMGAGKEPNPQLGKWRALLAEGPRGYAYNPFAGLFSSGRRRVEELPAMAATK